MPTVSGLPQLAGEVVLYIVVIPIVFPELPVTGILSTHTPLWQQEKKNNINQCCWTRQSLHVPIIISSLLVTLPGVRRRVCPCSPSAGNSSNSSSSSKRLCSVLVGLLFVVAILSRILLRILRIPKTTCRAFHAYPIAARLHTILALLYTTLYDRNH